LEHELQKWGKIFLRFLLFARKSKTARPITMKLTYDMLNKIKIHLVWQITWFCTKVGWQVYPNSKFLSIFSPPCAPVTLTCAFLDITYWFMH